MIHAANNYPAPLLSDADFWQAWQHNAGKMKNEHN